VYRDDCEYYEKERGNMTREKAIEIIECGDIYNRWGDDGKEVEQMAIKALEQEPKTGHWIMSDDSLYRPICDKCGAHPWKGYIPTVEEATEVFKYCPNCGTRMESEDKE
jgi:hypothetical protein